MYTITMKGKVTKNENLNYRLASQNFNQNIHHFNLNIIINTKKTIIISLFPLFHLPKNVTGAIINKIKNILSKVIPESINLLAELGNLLSKVTTPSENLCINSSRGVLSKNPISEWNTF